MAAEQGVTIASAQPDDTTEVEGANNRQQLATGTCVPMASGRTGNDSGATLIDPARFDCRGKLNRR